MLRATTTVIIGAGHAGLAMSRRLTERSLDHVVLERGEVANSWRTERWDSLRLLTPTWHTRLPGLDAPGDPDGFMAVPAVVSLLDGYARSIGAPVLAGTRVNRVGVDGDGFTVDTDRGAWRCASVVLATGPANVAAVPPFASALPRSIESVTPLTYRSPAHLADGGVLVVGGSASGVQLADEIHRSGRPVTLAVGEHVRLPRTYRGRDIFWWLDAAGVLDERHDQVDDLTRARHVPSPQLVGTSDHRSIGLDTLTELGVDVVGRVGAVRDGVALCSGALANVCRLADLKLTRLLDRLDGWAARAGFDPGHGPDRPAPTVVPRAPVLELDLQRRGIRTVVWATGYRPDLSWLDGPVFDHRGRIRHHGGVVSGAPGLYVLGGNLLRTRRSSYIGGAGDDTLAVAEHLQLHLSRVHRCCAAAAGT
ncbi:MAG: NAD(P)/FAD-dependent oxidoreductase [Ilumatobacteraceae bacterium]